MKLAELGFGSTLIGIYDWFIISIWQWVIQHNSCTLMNINADGSATPVHMICWDLSPLPLYIFTMMGILITLWIFLLWSHYIYDRWIVGKRSMGLISYMRVYHPHCPVCGCYDMQELSHELWDNCYTTVLECPTCHHKRTVILSHNTKIKEE